MTLEISLLEWVKDLGFPIVAFFLMYRMGNTTIKDNTQAILKLREVIISKR